MKLSHLAEKRGKKGDEKKLPAIRKELFRRRRKRNPKTSSARRRRKKKTESGARSEKNRPVGKKGATGQKTR